MPNKLKFMKNILTVIRNNYSEIFKIILLIISVILIVSLFPKEGKFKYEFQNGKPWKHNDLIAPFDFAIQKSDIEIEAEQTKALKNLKPYFNFNNDIAEQKKQDFLLEFEKKWNVKYPDKRIFNKIKKNISTISIDIIDSLFSCGILELHPAIDKKPFDYSIIIIKNNIAEEKQLKQFFTVQSAEKFIHSELNKKNILDTVVLLPMLQNILTQNVIYDRKKSENEKDILISNISLTRGMVQLDQRIISKGELITNEKFMILESLKKEYEGQLGESSNYYLILIGQIILVSIALICLILFLLFFRKEIFDSTKKLTLILLLIIFMVFLTSITIKFNANYLYIVPLCLAPIVIRAFFDTRLALFVHLITIIIICFLVPNSLEFEFLQLVAGIITIISVVNLQKRSQFFVTSVYIFLTYSIINIGMTLIHEGKIDNIDLMQFGLYGASAVLTLFAYPLIFIFEKIFGFITDVSLIEYSDTNNKLLRELASKAPGTFQHSIQVANLSEEALVEIGGNALLARTGALYHDIGKSDMPKYFIENQSGRYNPHDELNYNESAKIIISHVIKGIEKAKKHSLPEQIIDFIRTHHGTKKTDYFYNLYLNSSLEKNIDEHDFMYHGPIPFSKETSVVMMADAVEAASRSLKNPNEENINELVEKIIDKQLELKQFMNSDITLKEITKVKKIFKRNLLNINHIRMEYPDIN